MREVLVIGGGPVGLTLALLLAKQGTRVTVLEKDRAPETLLRAVSLDDECLRIWQSCGLEREIAPDWDGGPAGAVMCRYQNAHGRDFLRLRQHESDLGYPCAVAVHQTNLNRTLRHAAERSPQIEMLGGHSVTAISHSDDTAVVRGHTASGEPFSLAAPWVVGCDGAHSTVRRILGIDAPGRTLPRPWLVADVRDEHPGQTVEIRCVPGAATVTMPLPHGIRRVERLLPPDDPGDWIDDDPAVRERLATAWAGAADAEILHRMVFHFHSRIAERWRDGRVFLAGDAAHTSPPFAGQGMATGLRDASNLAFKLSGVCHGWLDESVLSSYEQERRPHQERINALALRLGTLMMPSSAARAAATQGLLRTIRRIGPVRERIELRGPSLRPVYRDGFLTPRGLAGHYIPQPWVTTGGQRRHRFDALLGLRMTWVALGRREAPGRMPGDLVSTGDTVLVEGRDFHDPERRLQRSLGEHSIVLVRPDRMIHTHISARQARRGQRRSLSWFSFPTLDSSPSRASSAS